MKQHNSSRLDPTAFTRFVPEITLTNPPRKKTETNKDRKKKRKKRSVIIIARKEKSAVVMDLGTKGSVYLNNLF